VACCGQIPLPATLHVTVSNQTGNCGLTNFVLFLHPDVPSWEGLDNNGRNWILICLAGGLTCSSFQLGAAGYGAQAFPQGGCSCSPLMLVFNEILAALPFCSGTVTLTVTI